MISSHPLSSIMSLFSSSNSKLCSLKSSVTFAFFFFILFIKVNSATAQAPSSDECNDPYKEQGLILNPDGTVTRLEPPRVPPSLDPTLPVLSKDLIINQSKGIWARIYLPRKALDHNSKLRLFFWYHGGAFIFQSPATINVHVFCSNLANDVGAVVASIDHREAPEHRLPAAYEDGVEALYWILNNKENVDWLKNYVDSSNLYIAGISSGGNTAYNVGLRVATEDQLDDEVFKIRGLVLIQPAFSGIQRTESEIRLANDPHMTLCTTDSMWKLGLPIGADRDHEYANPKMGDGPVRLEKIGRLGWRVLVTGCTGDIFFDRHKMFVRLLRKEGVRVVGHFTEGGYHGDDEKPEKAKLTYQVIKSFIQSLPAQNHSDA